MSMHIAQYELFKKYSLNILGLATEKVLMIEKIYFSRAVLLYSSTIEIYLFISQKKAPSKNVNKDIFRD